MQKVPILIITGCGVNCEAESRRAWEEAGGAVDMVHLNDLLEQPERLRAARALMFIGGFSYGDHMSSGHVFATRVRHHLREELQRFIDAGNLILGVCNGFQIMVKLGLLPGLDGDYFSQRVALMHNDCGAFQNYWVTLMFDPDSPCVFTKGLDRMPVPVRHGEGKVFTLDRALLDRMEQMRLAPCRYMDPASGQPTLRHPLNPNGSLNAIAGLCDPSGRIFGLMPHPEAYIYPENHPLWDFQRREGALPERGLGLRIFENAVAYMRQA